MTKFVLSPAATADIEGIADFLDEHAPRATERVLHGLRDAMHRIAKNPGIGRVRKDLADEPLRFLAVWSYFVVYRDSSPVDVVRVLHASRDIVRVLGSRRPRPR